jgi:hypothetical protein
MPTRRRRRRSWRVLIRLKEEVERLRHSAAATQLAGVEEAQARVAQEGDVEGKRQVRRGGGGGGVVDMGGVGSAWRAGDTGCWCAGECAAAHPAH